MNRVTYAIINLINDFHSENYTITQEQNTILNKFVSWLCRSESIDRKEQNNEHNFTR